MFPFGLCMGVHESDITDCSFGLITKEGGEHVYLQEPETQNNGITVNDTTDE